MTTQSQLAALAREVAEKPVAYLHTLHVEPGPGGSIEKLSRSDKGAFGVAGRDYDVSTKVTVEPLHRSSDLSSALIAAVKIGREGHLELLSQAWSIIANAGFGNWKLESDEWQQAAVLWRERYHSALAAVEQAEQDASDLSDSQAEAALGDGISHDDLIREIDMLSDGPCKEWRDDRSYADDLHKPQAEQDQQEKT